MQQDAQSPEVHTCMHSGLTKLCSHVRQGDTRIGQIDAPQPCPDHIVMQSHNQIVHPVLCEGFLMPLSYLPAAQLRQLLNVLWSNARGQPDATQNVSVLRDHESQR